ncbi:hypothetical protein D3C75_874690 [compost metagenome]
MIVPEQIIDVASMYIGLKALLELFATMLVDGHLEVQAVTKKALVEQAVDMLDEGLFKLKPSISIHPRFIDNGEIKLYREFCQLGQNTPKRQ